MAYLDLRGLEKRYDATIAVAHMDARIEEGTLVALLGPSGCGKTTTLRMVAGFVTPTAGEIHLDGARIDRLPPYRRNIGFVFQNYALFPHLTVAENVAFGLRMRRLGRPDRDRRVGEALALVGLAALADRYPTRQLSGGQQQRVALARALVIEPDMLLLDEPLSNLDAGLRGEMRDEIRRLQQRLGITTLFVTHDQQEALAMADRVMVMSHGRLIEDSDPRTLSEHPRHVFSAGFLGARSVLPGSVRNARFEAMGGLSVALGPEDPPDPSHLVLRAARLQLADDGDVPSSARFRARVTVGMVTYLGDVAQVDVTPGGGISIRVLRPTTLPDPAPGTELTLWADDNAVAFLKETGAEPRHGPDPTPPEQGHQPA